MSPIEQIEALLATMEAREKVLPSPTPRAGKVTIQAEPRTLSELYVVAGYSERLIAALRGAVGYLGDTAALRYTDTPVHMACLERIAKALTGEEEGK